MRNLVLFLIFLLFASSASAQDLRWMKTNHTSGVSDICVTSDGKWLVSVSAGEALVWDAATFQFIKRIELPNAGMSYSIAPFHTSNKILIANGRLRVLDPERGEIIEDYWAEMLPTYLRVNATDDTVAFCGYGSVSWLDLKTGLVIKTINASMPTDMVPMGDIPAISHNLRYVASFDAVAPGHLAIYDFWRDTTYRIPENLGYSFQFSQNDSLLFCNIGGTVKAVRLESVELLESMPVDGGQLIVADDTLIFAGGRITQTHYPSNQNIATYPGFRHGDYLLDEIWYPDYYYFTYVNHTLFARVARSLGKIARLDTRLGRWVNMTGNYGGMLGRSGNRLAAAISPDSRTVVGLDAGLAEYDLMTGEEIREIQANDSIRYRQSPTFSNNGQLAHIELLAVKDHLKPTGELVRRVVTPAATWSDSLSNRSCQATLSWDPITDNLTIAGLALDPEDTARTINFPCNGSVDRYTPDGQYFITANDKKLLLTDRAGVTQTIQTDFASGISSLAVAINGGRIATGGDNGAKVWDYSGRLISTIDGHGDIVTSVSLSNSGRELITGSRDSTIRVWDVATGAEIYRYDEFPYPVMSVELSADYKSLVATYSHSIVVYETSGWTSTRRVRSPEVRPSLVLRDRTLQISATTPGESLTVFDALGRNVYSASLETASTELSLAHLTAGLYFVRMQDRPVVKILLP